MLHRHGAVIPGLSLSRRPAAELTPLRAKEAATAQVGIAATAHARHTVPLGERPLEVNDLVHGMDELAAVRRATLGRTLPP